MRACRRLVIGLNVFIDDLLVRGHISDAELVCLAIAQLVLDAAAVLSSIIGSDRLA